jgi:transposase
MCDTSENWKKRTNKDGEYQKIRTPGSASLIDSISEQREEKLRNDQMINLQGIQIVTQKEQRE